MNIKQAFSVDSSIYGLGEDNLIYRWNHSEPHWVPNWDTRSPEEKDRVSQQFQNIYPARTPRTNPGC